MPTEYENRYSFNQTMTSEYVRKILCRRINRWGSLLAIVALLLFVIAVQKQDVALSSAWGICFLFILFIIIFTPLATLQRMKKNNQQVHQGQTVETVVQFGDKIAVSEGHLAFSLPYEQITAVEELQHSIVLLLGTQGGLLLAPQGFTKGDPEKFIAFINSKCPQLNKKSSK